MASMPRSRRPDNGAVYYPNQSVMSRGPSSGTDRLQLWCYDINGLSRCWTLVLGRMEEGGLEVGSRDDDVGEEQKQGLTTAAKSIEVR